MDTERAAAAFGEDVEVAASLGSLYDAEGIFLAGDGKRSDASSQVICRKTPLLGPPL